MYQTAWISDLLEFPKVMTCVTSTMYVQMRQNLLFFHAVNEESEALVL